MSDPANVGPGSVGSGIPIEWGVITPGLPNGLVFTPYNGRLEFSAVYFTRIGDIVTVTGAFNLLDGSRGASWGTRITKFPYDPTFRADYPLVAPGSVTCKYFPSPVVEAWIMYSSEKSVHLTFTTRSQDILRGAVMFSFVYSVRGIDLPPGTIQARFSDPIRDSGEEVPPQP